MSLDIVSNLIKLMKQSNPWWNNGKVPSSLLKPYKRKVFDSVYGLLESKTLKRNIILQGTRGSGKTVMVHQLIQELLDSGISPTNIMYITFDHPLTKLCSTELVLEIFYGNFAQDGETYIFFDEVQYTENWKEYLSQEFNSNSDRHFVCTLSVSPIEKNDDSENEFIWSYYHVGTLTFAEYCDFKNISVAIGDSNNTPINPDDLQNMSNNELKELFEYFKPLRKAFMNYLLSGGYPSLINIEQENGNIYDTCSDIIEKGLKSDIPLLFKTRTPQLLEKIFLYLTYNSGQPINLSAMSKTIDNTPPVTLVNYIEFLKQANLINMIPPISFNGKPIQKPKFKVFLSDTAIRHCVTLSDFSSIITDNDELKLLSLTALHKHFAGLYARSTVKVGYHKGTQNNPGIDVVLDTPSGRTLIDFRFDGNDSLQNRKYLSKCVNSETSNIRSAFILTKDIEENCIFKTSGKKKIVQIPTYIYLYLLG